MILLSQKWHRPLKPLQTDMEEIQIKRIVISPRFSLQKWHLFNTHNFVRNSLEI